MDDRLWRLLELVDAMSVSDVALLCDCEESTLEAWRKRGKGPSYVLAGNRYLYLRNDVTSWLETRRRERSMSAKNLL